jgi:hypothetical protein
MYQESMEERANRKYSYEDFLVQEVRKFPEVKRKEQEILKRSNQAMNAVYLVEGDGSGTYTVKILEDKGNRNQVLHLKYIVDSASGRILNKDGKP